MTAVRLTTAEARRLGIVDETQGAKRTTRKTARGPYRTRCEACGEEFTTMASEDRHVIATRHVRYELVL